MTGGGAAYLTLVIVGFLSFVGALAFASRGSTRARPRS